MPVMCGKSSSAGFLKGKPTEIEKLAVGLAYISARALRLRHEKPSIVAAHAAGRGNGARQRTEGEPGTGLCPDRRKCPPGLARFAEPGSSSPITSPVSSQSSRTAASANGLDLVRKIARRVCACELIGKVRDRLPPRGRREIPICPGEKFGWRGAVPSEVSARPSVCLRRRRTRRRGSASSCQDWIADEPRTSRSAALIRRRLRRRGTAGHSAQARPNSDRRNRAYGVPTDIRPVSLLSRGNSHKLSSTSAGIQITSCTQSAANRSSRS